MIIVISWYSNLAVRIWYNPFYNPKIGIFLLDCERHISGLQCSVLTMAASARHEANLMNFAQESAENDEIKPKKYLISMDIVKL